MERRIRYPASSPDFVQVSVICPPAPSERSRAWRPVTGSRGRAGCPLGSEGWAQEALIPIRPRSTIRRRAARIGRKQGQTGVVRRDDIGGPFVASIPLLIPFLGNNRSFPLSAPNERLKPEFRKNLHGEGIHPRRISLGGEVALPRTEVTPALLWDYISDLVSEHFWSLRGTK